MAMVVAKVEGKGEALAHSRSATAALMLGVVCPSSCDCV